MFRLFTTLEWLKWKDLNNIVLSTNNTNMFERLLKKELPEKRVSEALDLQKAGNVAQLAQLSTQLLQGLWNVLESEAYRSVENEAMCRQDFSGETAAGESVCFLPNYCGVRVLAPGETIRNPSDGTTYFFAKYQDGSSARTSANYAGFVQNIERLQVNVPQVILSFIECANHINACATYDKTSARRELSTREKVIQKLDKEDHKRRMSEGLTSAHFLVTGHSVNRF